MRRLAALFLFLGGFALLLVGSGSIGAGMLLRGGEALPDRYAWTSPVSLVSNRGLAPATVLLPLAGVPAADALNVALDAGHWENAYALVAYDTTLADPVRIGTLLQLGSRYIDSKNRTKAAWCYLAAERIAVISPLLSDAVRVETLVQASAGLRGLGALDAARLVTDQAYVVAQYSPALLREQQARRMTQIANAYAALGADGLAEQARSRATEPVAMPVDDSGYLPREPFVIVASALPTSPEVENAKQTRVQAAIQLRQDIQEIKPDHPIDWPQDSVAQLRDALIREDQARTAFYAEQLARSSEPAVKIALLRDRVNWLALKYRTARGAYGFDLVPDWGKAAPTIAEAWSAAWAELSNLYESQALAIPNAQAVSQAMEDVVRQELLTVRWGWYVASPQDLDASLGNLQVQLQQAAVPSLRLDSLVIGGKTVDFLLPDELYGKNAQALPR